MIKVGDTVWTVEKLWIEKTTDEDFCMYIPTCVSQQTVKEIKIGSGWFRDATIIQLSNGIYCNTALKRDFYLTEDEALKALREERKQFLTVYPNDWQKIVEELQQLLKEQSE